MDSTLTVNVELDVGEMREALDLEDTFQVDLNITGECDGVDADSDIAALTFYTPGLREGPVTYEVEVPWMEILGALDDCDPEEMARAIKLSGKAGGALRLLLKTEGVGFFREGLLGMTGIDRAVLKDELCALAEEL